MEIWKQVVGWEGLYEVSSLGRVKSLPRKFSPKETILAPQKGTHGYLTVTLNETSRGRRLKKTVHVLVCTAFHGKPDIQSICVNHKDGNKLNNSADNLEWVTYARNNKHAFELGLRYMSKDTKGKLSRIHSKPVTRICSCGSERVTYENMLTAGSKNNISPSSITLAIKENRMTGGYKWKYENRE